MIAQRQSSNGAAGAHPDGRQIDEQQTINARTKDLAASAR